MKRDPHSVNARSMVLVPGGCFLMGSDDFFPEEGPVREELVGAFWMDATPVTIAQFAAFVTDSGYVTEAERSGGGDGVRGASLVFWPPAGPTLNPNPLAHWELVQGADWLHPLGPGGGGVWEDSHPVVHVTKADAHAYARWCGKRLPTEAEWERAARGVLDSKPYAWGDELDPQGRMLANYWQGEFPWQNLCLDGYDRTSPVASYPCNSFGLFDMIGNVWEWTVDSFTARAPVKRCCAGPSAQQRPAAAAAAAAAESLHQESSELFVLKGGSHLCAENYCGRYRPAARYGLPADTSSCHIGFRCVRNE